MFLSAAYFQGSAMAAIGEVLMWAVLLEIYIHIGQLCYSLYRGYTNSTNLRAVVSFPW